MPALSHGLRLTPHFVTLCRGGSPDGTVPQPRSRNACRLSRVTGLAYVRFRSPLLAESRLLSLPVGNEMFHFPTFPPRTVCVRVRVTGHDPCRVSPFGHPRITAWLTAPRGLSQPPTSFFGSWCQGIHRAPLLTWPQRCSRPLCSSQDTDVPTHGSPRTPATGAVRRGPVLRPRCRSSGGTGAQGELVRSLRTQQRASTYPESLRPVRATEVAVLGLETDSRVGQLVSVPPLSPTGGSFVRPPRDSGGRAPPRGSNGARCSLERR